MQERDRPLRVPVGQVEFRRAVEYIGAARPFLHGLLIPRKRKFQLALAYEKLGFLHQSQERGSLVGLGICYGFLLCRQAPSRCQQSDGEGNPCGVGDADTSPY